MRQQLIARFSRCEKGQASLEFVLLFPLIVLVFCMMFEAAVFSVRQAMINVAIEDVTRELRIASALGVEQPDLVAVACEAAVLFPDCENTISIEVAPVDVTTWAVSRDAMNCIDRDAGFIPVQEYDHATANDLMMLRMCVVFNPVFPTSGLGAMLKRVNDSDYALVAAAAYVNEPI